MTFCAGLTVIRSFGCLQMAEEQLWLANKLPPPDVDISFHQSFIQALKMRTMWIRWRLMLVVAVFVIGVLLLYHHREYYL